MPRRNVLQGNEPLGTVYIMPPRSARHATRPREDPRSRVASCSFFFFSFSRLTMSCFRKLQPRSRYSVQASAEKQTKISCFAPILTSRLQGIGNPILAWYDWKHDGRKNSLSVRQHPIHRMETRAPYDHSRADLQYASGPSLHLSPQTTTVVYIEVRLLSLHRSYRKHPGFEAEPTRQWYTYPAMMNPTCWA